MINFTRLELRNFLSFGNITEELDLSVDGSTLILGDNVDTNSKNGAGKCVGINTLIRIRNTKNGEILELTIGEFYEIVNRVANNRHDM